MLMRPATGERNDDFAVGEAQDLAPVGVVTDRYARLRQARVQIDRVRHDGCADDADGEQERFGIGNLRHERVIGSRAPIDRRDEHLDQITNTDHADDGADDEFERAEAVAFAHQQGVGNDGGDRHADNQRQVEQQGEADGATEEFGEVGRHRGNLADDPHGENHRP